MSSSANISWAYSGKSDGLAGTGATVAERLLAYGFAVLITIGLVGYLRIQEHPAAFGWRAYVLSFFVFDIAGGVVANMLNSCKRLYHAPLKENETGFLKLVKNPMAFTLLHVHPVIFAWVYGANVWIGAFWYLALICSVAVVLASPLYLRRPLATAFVVIASLVSYYGLGFGPGFEWFIPCLFFKITLAHTVREEPYRPVERLS